MCVKSKPVTFVVTIVLGVVAFLASWSAAALPEEKMCGDPLCQKFISLGTTSVTYNPPEPYMVSFKINTRVRILAKSAKLWAIEVNGRQGWAPKNFIQETRVLVKEAELIKVPVESGSPQINTSENLEVKLDAESTTTAPLIEVPPVVTTESSITHDNESSTVKSPLDVAPDPAKVEIVDGTQIPVFEETLGKAEKTIAAETANDDEDYGEDYDDEEEEEEEEDELGSQIEPKGEAKVPKQEQKTLPVLESQGKEVVKEGSSREELQKIEENKEESKMETTHKDNSTGIPSEQEAKLQQIQDVKNDSEPIELLKKATASPESLTQPLEEQAKVSVPKMIEEIKNTTKMENTQQESSEFNQISEKLEDKTENVVSQEVPQLLQAGIEEVANEVAGDIEDILSPIGLMQVEEDDEAEKKDKETEEEKGEEVAKEVPKAELEELKKELQPEPKVNATTEDVKALLTTPGNEPIKEETHDSILTVEAKKADELPILDSTKINQPDVKEPEPDRVPPIQMPQESQDSATPPILIPVPPGPQEMADELPQFESTTIIPPTAAFRYEPHINNVPYMETTIISQPVVQQQDTTTMAPSLKDEGQVLNETKEETIKVTEQTEAIPVEAPTLPLFQGPGIYGNPPQDANTEKVPPYSQEDLGNFLNNQELNTNQYASWQSPESLGSKEEIPETQANPTPTKPEIYDQDDKLKAGQEPFDATQQQDSSETVAMGNVEIEDSPSTTLSTPPADQPSALPSTTPPVKEPTTKGLFGTIVDTVKNVLSSPDKNDGSEEDSHDAELHRILYPDQAQPNAQSREHLDEQYCEKLSPENCPSHSMHSIGGAHPSLERTECACGLSDLTMDNFAGLFAAKALEMSDLLVCLVIAAAATLFFVFGYYCFCNSSREGALLAKLNLLERSLLATHKENAMLKDDLMKYRTKLSSIEDNSFGSNDMVIALKKELEEEMLEKRQLQEQVSRLEKEVETAAEAGLELNKIISELLNNQNGDESIISSVEELQRQLNEQQSVIMEINSNLAEKSRENSELQIMLAEQNASLNGQIASLQQDNDELEAEKSNLQTRLEEIKTEFEQDITKALEGKNNEIKRLQNDIVDLQRKCEDEHTRWQTSLAKVEALEECLESVKKDPKVNIKEVMDVANAKAEMLDLQKKRAWFEERLAEEVDMRKHSDQQLQSLMAELNKFKQDFHQSEKDKLEAQTRLEVLSNYFKEKETQLQKELSLKEAMWLKQQGEATSTVDRLTAMQDEIQSLKSQNDSLRAEIEAQLAAHKAQIGTLENRAHETWLAGRQWERRYEESRAEATALRRKLTALGGGNPEMTSVGKLASDRSLNNAPSPIHMEPPGSPLLGRLPPPFLPPFLPPPPFMGLPPPPPFGPPGEMRPPPLGRMMSPPPPLAGGSGISGDNHGRRPQHSRQHPPSGRYISTNEQRTGDGDFDDYDDDYYDDDDDTSYYNRPRRRSVDHWRRDDYSPPPRSYRSHSPTDSRYNYTGDGDRDLISTYDTETDLSPPPSPTDNHRSRGSRTGSYKAYSPPPSTSNANANEFSNNNNSGGQKKGSSANTKKGRSINSKQQHRKVKGSCSSSSGSSRLCAGLNGKDYSEYIRSNASGSCDSGSDSSLNPYASPSAKDVGSTSSKMNIHLLPV